MKRTGQVRTVRVESDDLESQGQGSWVELRASLKLRYLKAFANLQKLQNIDRSDLEAISKGFDSVCDALSRFVVRWNWVDEDGESLESPKRNVEVFEDLEFDELKWLIDQVAVMIEGLVSKKK